MFRSVSLTFIFLLLPSLTFSQTIELYVDQNTKQVFTEPGKGRVRLGVFAPVVDGHAPQASSPTITQVAPSTISETPSAVSAPVAAADLAPKKEKEWYDKLSVRGYTQLRYTSLWDREGAKWSHPTDRSVSEDTTFIIRRARLALSGDVSDRLYVFVQPELMASPVEGSDSSIQLRDIYSDIALDGEKEYRVRLGQSKVPFGFSNLQLDNSAATLEKADAMESAEEGERDIGAFLYWAPAEIRKRFKQMTLDGLKSTGDYGLVGFGAYSGQGANRSDTNNSPHLVARLTYPFLFSDGRIFEPAVQAYTGRFVPKTKPFTVSGEEVESTPIFRSDGVKDDRVGISAVLYPQPLGFEAEWDVGKGPELSDDFKSIDEKSLEGGYLQANYKLDVMDTVFFPFIRWQYYDGGRKFGKNAPQDNVNEWDFGVEMSPWKELDLTAQYSYTTERTNTNVFPYDSLTGGSRLGLQAQVNY